MKRHSAVLVLFFCLVTSAAGLRSQRVEDARTPPRYVIMVSIDGLKPETYTKPGPSKVPTLRRLAQEGAYADGVIGVTPTVTYPSHTTLITGVLPAVHGIPQNTIVDPDGSSESEWYRFARDIQAATLPGVIKSRNMTAAGVFWPVSIGMDLDYNVPEVAYYRHPKHIDLMRALSTPRLLDDYEIAQKKPLTWPMTDDDRTGLAQWIFRTYRPNLTLLHIFATDSAQHTYGPDTPEAYASIEKADAHVKQLVDEVSALGLESQTDFVIVSDHGFLPVRQQLQLNALFKQEGLLKVDAAGKIASWDAYFHPNGGSAFILLKNPQDEALYARVGALLARAAKDPANGINAVWNRDELKKRGADPRASYGVDMKEGFYSDNATDVVVKATTSKGGHGFDPNRPELHASLILRGPDVPKMGSLGLVRMTQIAPTVASWFGLSMPPSADQALPVKAARASASATSSSR